MADSLKGFVNVVAGVAGTNAMGLLVTRDSHAIPFGQALFGPYMKDAEVLPTPVLPTWVTLVLLLLFFIRFFHGNIRYLDEPRWTGQINSFLVANEFVAMFLEGLCLAAMSFYFVAMQPQFFGVFTAALVIDTVRVVIRAAVQHDTTPNGRKWAWNNGLAAIGMLAIYLISLRGGGEPYTSSVAVVVLLLNSLYAILGVDLGFFFPSFTHADAVVQA